MTSPFTEAIVEQAALAWLENTGWSVKKGAEIAPGEPAAERLARVFSCRRVVGGVRRYLVRVFVDVDRNPAEVITVYRTSKIGTYWRSES